MSYPEQGWITIKTDKQKTKSLVDLKNDSIKYFQNHLKSKHFSQLLELNISLSGIKVDPNLLSSLLTVNLELKINY